MTKSPAPVSLFTRNRVGEAGRTTSKVIAIVWTFSLPPSEPTTRRLVVPFPIAVKSLAESVYDHAPPTSVIFCARKSPFESEIFIVEPLVTVPLRVISPALAFAEVTVPLKLVSVWPLTTRNIPEIATSGAA